MYDHKKRLSSYYVVSKEKVMRQDVYDLFARYEPQFQYHWNQIIASGFEAFAAESAKHAAAMGLNQSLE